MIKRFLCLPFCCLLLVLAACDSELTSYPATDYDNTYAWKQYNPLARTLYKCVRAISVEQACRIGELPLIKMQHSVIDRDAVLDRLVVSHQWMGDNFVAYLDSLPAAVEQDLLQLFGSVTAIVIDDSVKPSYYSYNTGAIYLDPDQFWLTQAQLDSLPSRVDYRQAYARRVAFLAVWSYLNENGELLFPRNFLAPRQASDLHAGLSSLLFHELAHAADIFPTAELVSVDPRNRLIYLADNIYHRQKQLSQQLRNQFPLDFSNPWFGLARVLFHGDTPSSVQATYTASQVGAFLDADVANDEYAYATRYEDLAMLFEELMMLKHFNIQRELAYLTATVDGAFYCNEFSVDWAMLHRVAKPGVWERAEFVAGKILPGIDLSQTRIDYPDAVYLPTGGNWCHTLAPTATRVIGDASLQPQPLVKPPLRPVFEY